MFTGFKNNKIIVLIKIEPTMDTNKFTPFFKGYLRAVLISLISMQLLLIVSTSVLDWFFIVYILLTLIGFMLHFAFVFVLYIFIFPWMVSKVHKAEQVPFRKLMDRYIPLFAIPFATLIGVLWMNDCLSKFFTFVILDVLFTCYIGLYFYAKNKFEYNEIA